ncbi:RNA polymerase subunit sigma [Mycobacterium sp. E1386]|uniref:sigma-70 family RNA polymerase sigma factor n=1 Tax=Mycobacterium sp. E1386 TaxID=1834126 RepID=UPI000800B020|nr:sigma-70 family RNA polymerase sigma factor [Mycobacterium sp. E1386]OBI38661.1 RNA polymerase subunit sigma [Mycobacterium sp. E1386]
MSAPKNLSDLAQRFDADRRHLRSVALQLLGSAADADDAVQSAWLKASRADFAAVDNLTGWFTTITAREAVDQLRARKRRAEQPLATPDELDRIAATASASADEEALLTESVSNALLVVLDRLSPAQRVAFVLHDVFAVPFERIAGLLDRSPEAAKKLASRARARVAHPGAEPERIAKHLEVVEAFLAASRGGDIAGLLALLAPDVVRRVDRALVPDDVPTELRGARQVAEETRRFALRARAGVVVLIDGAPGIAIAPRGRAEALLMITVGTDDRIRAIDIIGDAGRVRRAVLALPSWPRQQHHSRFGYQGQEKPPVGRPATGREREQHAR